MQQISLSDEINFSYVFELWKGLALHDCKYPCYLCCSQLDSTKL